MSSLLGLGRSSEEKTAKRNQDALLTQQGQLATSLADVGKDRYTLTQPAYKQAINYYEGMLSGNRARNLQAVQPDIRRITDINTGSMNAVNRNLRGASRDQAISDLVRSRTADIGALTGAPRREAAATLLAEGRGGSDFNLNALSGSAGVSGQAAAGYGQQVLAEQQRRQAIMQNLTSLGGGLAKLMAPYLMGGGAAASAASKSAASAASKIKVPIIQNPWG